MTSYQLSSESAARWLRQNSTRLLRLGMIFAVIAISVVAPVVIPESRFILAPGLVLGIAAIWLFMRWPTFGLLALVITALLVPSPTLPGGLNFAVLLLCLLIALWLFDMIIHKRIKLINSRAIWPLLALVLVACISFGFGQLGWFSYAQSAPLDAQIGGLLIFILSVGAFLITAHQTSLRWLQVLTFAFIALGALFMVGWMIPPLGAITGRLYQPGATSNSMFWMWLPALAFGQAAFNRKLHIGWRIALVLLVVLSLYVGYFRNSGWKSGYLPSLVAILAIIASRSWRAGLVIALLGILPMYYLSTEAIGNDEYSYLTRMDAWYIMLDIIKVSPILGFGPANYYWYTPLFPIRGYAVQFNSHNQYIDIAAQTGILGLICFLWFGVEMAWLSLKLRDRAAEGFSQAYVYGAIGGLAGTFAAALLADWVFPFTYNIGLAGMGGSLLAWIFLGGVIAIEQITKQTEQERLDNRLVAEGVTV